ncbi:fatty-acid amide hydrolase 2-like protein [Leptotrombidium deliense]|uniref:Fatty-acid amide hydrolase 2-like protein n=1 Tax=Leptotrombidium deliense TaxID=299467 RepID=A0A443RVJ4_9ACAR|nr:fatty-acid amide hydrolase 2-like protein [Leptotrombidium deliense]
MDHHAAISGEGPKINLCLEFMKAIFGLSNHTIQSITFASMSKRDPNYDKRNFESVEKLKKKFCDLLGPRGIFLYPSGASVAKNHIHTYVDCYNFGYTCVFNVLGVPVTQCPLGLNKDGLPLGVQVVAAPYNDHLTLAVAKELESAFGGWVSPCKIEV